jgi:thiol-disulfide isomerase/thioredoxin
MGDVTRWLSDLRGKPTLITFWAPWCSPCREELAALDRIQNSTKSPLQIVAIAVQDRRTHAVDFIRGHEEYKFLFFTDPDMERETSPLASFFGVVGIPVTVLADPQGQIVESWSGYDGEEAVLNPSGLSDQKGYYTSPVTSQELAAHG